MQGSIKHFSTAPDVSLAARGRQAILVIAHGRSAEPSFSAGALKTRTSEC
jgi:hypothetical protein